MTNGEPAPKGLKPYRQIPELDLLREPNGHGIDDGFIYAAMGVGPKSAEKIQFEDRSRGGDGFTVVGFTRAINGEKHLFRLTAMRGNQTGNTYESIRIALVRAKNLTPADARNFAPTLYDTKTGDQPDWDQNLGFLYEYESAATTGDRYELTAIGVRRPRKPLEGQTPFTPDPEDALAPDTDYTFYHVSKKDNGYVLTLDTTREQRKKEISGYTNKPQPELAIVEVTGNDMQVAFTTSAMREAGLTPQQPGNPTFVTAALPSFSIPMVMRVDTHHDYTDMPQL